MNPVNLFSQYFGKTVPFLMIPVFLLYFWAKYNECGDVVISLKHAAGKIFL